MSTPEEIGASTGLQEAPHCTHTLEQLRNIRRDIELTLTADQRREAIARVDTIIKYKENHGTGS